MLFLIGCLSGVLAVAQEQDRYFIYFKNKGAATNTYALNAPEAFLGQRALDRRMKEGITVDSTDLPVNSSYAEQVSATGADVFFASKWLNGILIQATAADINQIKSLAFVDSVRLVAAGTRLVKTPDTVEEPTSFDPPAEILGDTDIQLMMLGADLMHEDDLLGQGIQVAVFDNGFTGVNRYSPFEHLWANEQIVATKDFVENSGNVYQFGSHGTSVFSIIGARYANDTMAYTGIANGADFILCVTEDNQGENTLEEYNWVFAAEYADSIGVDIINSSLGYRTFDIEAHDYSFDDLDGNTSIITRAVEMAASKGILVATSAGNSGRRSAPGNLISHPGDADSVLVVASVDPDFTRSEFSSVGPTIDGRTKPDIAAFGNGTAVVRGNGDIERGGGTSFASPLIAGFAAGILQANPEWTSQDVIRAITNSGHKSLQPDSLLGYGVPNYSYAVTGEARSLSVEDILEERVTIYPNPFTGNSLNIRFSEAFASDLSIRVVDANGKLLFSKEFAQEEIATEMKLTLDSIQQGLYYLFLQTESTQRVVKLINF